MGHCLNSSGLRMTKPYDDPVFKNLPCTPAAIDPYLLEYAQTKGESTEGHGVRYPAEWYADKDNRVAGRAMGHLRYEGGKMIWIPRATR